MIQNILLLWARIFISGYFILDGGSKITNWSASIESMASHGFQQTSVFLIAAICAEIGGALLILIGYKARIGAIALLVYLIIPTFYFNAFWSVSGMEQKMQMIHFLKNLSIMGGLLALVASGPGAISADRK